MKNDKVLKQRESCRKYYYENREYLLNRKRKQKRIRKIEERLNIVLPGFFCELLIFTLKKIWLKKK